MAELPADFSFLDSPGISRVIVGLSGGVDSVVLLHAVTEVAKQPVIALHINHHLHDRAEEAATFCRSLDGRDGVRVQVIDVDVAKDGSLETRAREARYAAFEGFLQQGDVLLLAHHADDQVETALFKLFRGSRVFGLEGMPVARELGAAYLCRPLLAAGRDDILAYAHARNLKWIEDPTNQDLTPDRNFIRQELLPLINSRFPAARSAILASIRGDQHAREQLFTMWSARLEPQLLERDALALGWLSELPMQEIADLLTVWLMRLDVPQPTGRFLAELSEKIRRGLHIDQRLGDYTLHSFNGTLYIGRQIPEEIPCDAPLESRIAVPGGYISNVKTKGLGLRAQSDFEIRYRTGGEKLTIRRKRSLKNIFQEQDVPPWLRDRVPLIYSGSELVAVAALPDWGVSMLVADGWQAREDEPGSEVSLHLADRIR